LITDVLEVRCGQPRQPLGAEQGDQVQLDVLSPLGDR
jgi:hypothetical protein